MAMAAAPTMHRHSVRTPANAVTILRLILAPILIVIIAEYAPAWWVLIFGFLAMITDRVDGILARKYGISKLGIFLDPIADKVMVLGSMYVIVAKGWSWWLPVAIITLREIAMSLFRSYYARKGISVPARYLAKIKTWAQSFAVAFVLIPGVERHASWFPTSVMWIAVVLSVYTFAQYWFDGRPTAEKPIV